MTSKHPPLNPSDVTETWQQIWHNSDNDPTVFTNQLDSNSRQILEVLLRETSDLTGRKAIEVGCGTGRISLGLAQAQFETHLLDISSAAIDLSRRVFIGQRCRTNSLQASMMGIPLPSKTFDLVWNSGVLEHFKYEHQLKALAEMARICKPGGKVIIIVPYFWAPIYRLGKWYAEKKGTFEFGYEDPMKTLAQHLKPGMSLRLRQEYTLGFITQAHFLTYIPALRFVARGLIFLERRWFGPLNRMPLGWLLVSVLEKI
jgi:ubiquinone/menaquinone biosynthesis C-methylase UbiE